jgi:dTDP-4-amino-4,6-dideoxygalactose transaminase
MRVPFLDLRVTDNNERAALLKSYGDVLDHGRLVMGPEVEELENAIATYCHRKYSVAVGSGSDALYLALRALDIKAGDEVITTSLSWVATANAIGLTGATPVFADIRDDLNIDPESVERLITPRTKALLVVDYTGKICDMNSLEAIAAKHGLVVVEDGSQSFGATYHGRPCGSFGQISCISHNPMKVLAATGEAGSILVDTRALYDRLVSLRYNGTINRETCVEPSMNARMDTVQASVLLARLNTFPLLIKKRRQNASYLTNQLVGIVATPQQRPFEDDVYYTYTIRSTSRDELKAYLESREIETKIQHLILMPDQPAYRNNVRGEFTNARKMRDQILCIPSNEKINQEQLSYVVEKIKEFGATAP